MNNKLVRRGRAVWLADMINNKGYTSGAEIGTALGWTTNWVLHHCENLEQYLAVDDWRPVTDINWGPFTVDNMKQRFDGYVMKTPKLKILEGVSWEMAKKVKDKSLDFVFVDASHDYESVVKDFNAWAPKVKPGGIFSGHDVHWPGVIQALNELHPDFEKAGVDNVWFKFM